MLKAHLPKSIRQSDWLCAVGLAIAALVLYWLQVGQVALRDWDEGTIATVAKEMVRSGDWLYPTLYGGPYLNKPPLVEWLISLSYQVGGMNEWTARLLPAGISALAVPLLYGVGRAVFPQRATAFWSASVYLTLLPVVRHGRLAMRDGVAVTGFLLLLLCLLKARQDRRWALGAGIALGLIALTKGILALLLGAIALLFLLVNRQWSLLCSPFLWGGLLLGGLPAIAWYGLQIQHYGALFWQGHFQSQSLDRIWDAVDEHNGPVWYYLLELLKYSWPWLLFWPSGLILAWKQRNQAWAQLVGVGTLVYLGTISIMGTKLPWYILPLYPFVALAIGAQLGQIWQKRQPFYRLWAGLFGFLAIAGCGAALYISVSDQQPVLAWIGPLAGLTFGLTAWLLFKRDRRFIPVLGIGLYLILSLLMGSRLWLWELNEAYPVRPVAAIVQAHTPTDAAVYTTFAYHRPSLDFYSDRHIAAISFDTLPQFWNANTYFLIEQNSLPDLISLDYKIVETIPPFVLITPHFD